MVINGGSEIRCMGDSGASQTTISASMLKDCNGLKTEKRARPLKISLASSDYSVEVNMEAKATIEIVSLGRVNILCSKCTDLDHERRHGGSFTGRRCPKEAWN